MIAVFLLLSDLLASLLHFFLVALITPFVLIYFGLYSLGLYIAGSSTNNGRAKRKISYDISKARYNSMYFKASDDVELALDIWLPEKKSTSSLESFPVMLNAARYYRSCRVWWPFSYLRFFGGKPFSLLDQDFISSFLSDGIAVVVYDIRGAGASFGIQSQPWSPREVLDSEEILNWIISQPFCNGKVGLWGVSYGANSAYHLTLREAVSSSYQYNSASTDPSLGDRTVSPGQNIVACASLFGFWRMYEDLSHPVLYNISPSYCYKYIFHLSDKIRVVFHCIALLKAGGGSLSIWMHIHYGELVFLLSFSSKA
jgi:hypothetical protein